jgi:L-alanine-DL-glutamate epimerase-like enolase superfamily enzyme
MPRQLETRVERLHLKAPFRISGHVFTHMDVVVVTLEENGARGRGEASGVYYLGDDVQKMLGQIEKVRGQVEEGLCRNDLQALLPPCGARNALDCALWELEAGLYETSVWKLAGLSEPKAVVTTFTLGAADPASIRAAADRYVGARAIKLKLGGDAELDLARIDAVRAALPDVWLGVDANQGFSRSDLDWLLHALLENQVALLEQPIPRGAEDWLENLRSPIPIAADESVQGLADLPGLIGRFDVVNIKLDKCGGLTEALLMAQEARRLGLGVMVGNMIGSSLAMAPAFLVAQAADFADLDGPVFLAADRHPAVSYEGGRIWCGENVWGAPVA